MSYTTPTEEIALWRELAMATAWCLVEVTCGHATPAATERAYKRMAIAQIPISSM